MRHPPYHLRLNKAVDRLILVDILATLARHVNLEDYRYYGLGGPFLEDFRVLAQEFDDLAMICLEASDHTYRRQRFHRCAKNVTLRRETVESFLATYSGDERAIFWLDYTDLQPSRIQEFQTLLDRVAEGSLVKLTLKGVLDDLPDFKVPSVAVPPDQELEESCRRYLQEFRATFDAVLPPTVEYRDLRSAQFPALLQGMLRVAAQRALPPGSGRGFQIVHSCFYSDHTQMYSLAGIVCREGDEHTYRNLFRRWPPRNLRWVDPKRIDMPVLSAKERMLLEEHLPARRATGRGLRRVLGYNVDDSRPSSVRKLGQYAMLYKYYPVFGKVSIV